MLQKFLYVAICITLIQADIHFSERFEDGDKWTERWIQSKHKDNYGEFKLALGRDYDDEKRDKGIQTSKDASFYALSAKFKKFSNRGKTLIIQFSVKHDQDIDCGGGYVKILPANVDFDDFNNETPFYIMFGPDICGDNLKAHLILYYKEKHYMLNEDKRILIPKDQLTHMYTLILKPDKHYEVLLDRRKELDGKIDEDFNIFPPKKLKDPNASRPKDWDDHEFIDDPNDKKPDGWDKPEYLQDPDAKKPDDWDEDMDGEWEPPMIDNPEYKGEWTPKQIQNPNYQGIWVHPEIDNPEYNYDPEVGIYDDIGGIGFDLWQVKAGTIFDNILISDDPMDAKVLAIVTFDQLMITERYKQKIRKKEMNEKLTKKADMKKEEEEEEDDDEDEDETDGDKEKKKVEEDERKEKKKKVEKEKVKEKKKSKKEATKDKEEL